MFFPSLSKCDVELLWLLVLVASLADMDGGVVIVASLLLSCKSKPEQNVPALPVNMTARALFVVVLFVDHCSSDCTCVSNCSIMETLSAFLRCGFWRVTMATESSCRNWRVTTPSPSPPPLLLLLLAFDDDGCDGMRFVRQRRITCPCARCARNIIITILSVCHKVAYYNDAIDYRTLEVGH